LTQQTTFTVQDPRQFDGDPYQVAERAIQQLRAVLDQADKLLPATVLMVRNADLERTLALGNSLGDVAAEWPESPQGRKLAQVEADLAGIRTSLELLQRAAAYNPKAR
jgi:hypothetical protein